MNKTLRQSLAVLTASLASLALADPGSGIMVGTNTTLSPEIAVTAGYSDNVNIRRRAISRDDRGVDIEDKTDSDTFISTELTLRLTRVGAATQWTGAGWINNRNYLEYGNLDSNSFGGRTSLFWSRADASTTVVGEMSYLKAIDKPEYSYDFIGDWAIIPETENVAERLEREETRGSVTLNQKILKDLAGSATWGVSDIQYNEEAYNDRSSQRYSGELNYRVSPKTQPYVRMSLEQDEEETLIGDGEKVIYLVGTRYRPTPKLNFDAAVGEETYTRTLRPAEGSDEVAVEQEDSSFKWNASVNWAAMAKTRISLTTRSGYGSVASVTNSRDTMSVALAVQHQTTRQISQRVSISWREDDYLEPIGTPDGEVNEVKETIWYQYRLDYQTSTPWLSVFTLLSFEDGSSKLPGENFTETQVQIGARARY